MLISKFDLYNPEWLEVVFENRNKEYGAYYFRKNYSDNMVKAMIITFSGLSLIGGVCFVFKSHPAAARKQEHEVVVVISPPPVTPIKKVEPPVASKPLPPRPAPSVATTKFVVMVPKPDQTVTETPPKIDELKGAIGPETVKGNSKDDNVIPVDNTAGTGTPAPDNTVYPPTGLDVMPEPVGGEGAWSKFLSRNLRFPFAAQEDGVSGKVFLSFIIEKDGTLSNISVIRPAGHGFDEEALRVLKLAKAWKPGVQNGQAVRVKYTIPINFQVAENN